ncbi:MAG: hypothetical protein JNL38_26275 [Myxococcales bacterium]|nr:hypothetical protein [Myxococcales bacterium]
MSRRHPRSDTFIRTPSRLEQTFTELAPGGLIALDDLPTTTYGSEHLGDGLYSPEETATPPYSSRGLIPTPAATHAPDGLALPSRPTPTSSLPPRPEAPIDRFFAEIRRVGAEARALWEATAAEPYEPVVTLFDRDVPPRMAEPLGRGRRLVKRVLRAWRSFEWTRADYVRAAIIGGATFTVAMLLVVIPMLSSAERDASARRDEAFSTERTQIERR